MVHLRERRCINDDEQQKKEEKMETRGRRNERAQEDTLKLMGLLSRNRRYRGWPPCFPQREPL